MAQTVKSQWVSSGWIIRLLNKPQVLNRIFFNIKMLTDPTSGYRSLISFDDPTFASHYVLDGPMQQLEARGEGIFQGDIWAHNTSPVDLVFTMTEILV